MKIFIQCIKAIFLWFFLIESFSAIAQKEPLEKKYHGNDSQDSVKGAGYYFDAGTAKAQAGDCEAALDLYDKCISIDPETYDAYFNRAYCKMQLQDYEAAIADFTTCMQLHRGTYSTALYLRGDCFKKLKQYDLALADFSKALEVSSNPDILADRGYIYMQKGDFGKAASDYTHAIEKRPDSTELYGQRAICQYRIRHLKEAVGDARIFLSKQPSSPEVTEVELRAQIEMNDYTNALQTAKNLVAIEKSPKSFYYKGLIEFSQGKYPDGIVDFTSALSLDSTYKDAYYSRALCYSALKNDASACEDLHKAKNLGFANLEGKIEACCKDKKQ